MTDSSPTRRLAHFASTLRLATVPAGVVIRAKELLLDYVGHTLSAAGEDPARRLIRFAKSVGGPAESRIIGSDLAVASPWAALVNGAMGHMAELDDTHRGTMSHPGDSIWAAGLALAEKDGLSGEELLTAAIAGYETGIRVGEAVMPDHYRRGWHTSGTMMAFGAAATAGRLLGLDPEAMAWALGTAGAQAAGNFAHLSERAMTKDFNCGQAAKSGVIAALLAREGFTGPTDVLENPRGFLALYGSANNRPERLTAGLGQAWKTLEIAQKPYSACRYIHASIDALLALRNDARFGARDVRHITARILSTGAALVNDPLPWEGDKGLQGTRFSAQFNLAVALLHGREGLWNLLDKTHPLEYRDAPEIREIMRTVTVIADAELDRNFPDQWSSIVEVELKSGERSSRRVDYPLGEPETPMAESMQIEKFKRLTALAGWSEAKSMAFAALVHDCERTPTLEPLLLHL
ncbi:MAG: MmgE/PrpD family protein [Burkholderiales bacterium]|nr:MmgE/PrpD family protein [Burkholderiales bacterium]